MQRNARRFQFMFVWLFLMQKAMQSWIKVTSFLRRSFHVSAEAYASVIDSYANHAQLRPGIALHARVIINGLACRTHIASKLIAFYAACGKLAHVRQVFDEIPDTNIRRWIALIGAFSQRGFYRQALGVFEEMRREGIRHDAIVVPSVLKACGHLGEAGPGEEVHGVIVKCSFDCDPFVVSALVDMYSKTGWVEKARRVFDEMAEKDLVALNALVSGYAQCGLPREALDLVERMEVAGGLVPNIVTWNSLVAGFSQKGDGGMVSRLLQLMRSRGIEPDVVSWSSVVSGFVQNFRNEEAFGAFKQMLAHGLCPSSAAISSLLSACSVVANVRRGKEIHGYVLAIGIEESVFVRSALVDMYGKSGYMRKASALFFNMTERNTVTWNSMIFGYANNGYCNEAIELFNQMTKEDESKLNHLTFTAVLTACSHARMVDLGQSLFHLMQEEYGIVPRLEHYACVVDLLGRAGKLAEAYEIIKSMPVKPDLFVWGALLGACTSHGNIDFAEVAAKHLAELEPESAANKKLLSSLYADAGLWGNVTRLKKTMSRKKFSKIYGCSWIETT